MSYLRKPMVLLLFPILLFCATTGEVEIYLTVPDGDCPTSSTPSTGTSTTTGKITEVIEIQTFFTPSNNSYQLTPEQQKKQRLSHSIFTAEEGFAILDKNSHLFKNVPTNKLVSIHLTLPSHSSSKEVYISFKEGKYKKFTLIPRNKKYKPLRLQVFLADASKPLEGQKLTEIKAGKKYPLSLIQKQTLYIKIHKNYWNSRDTINFSHYSLPMEVIYNAP